jgi:hypothetical protein
MNPRLGACLLSLLGLSFLGNVCMSRALGPAPTSCTELLQDGSFEAGGQGWLQQSAQGYELISNFNPHAGRLGAYLAGVNDADDRLSQQIALPQGATIVLQGWWFLATAESAGAFDTMTVALLRPDGTPLADLITVDNTAEVGIWDEILLDLTPYAGQTVVLRFAALTDASNISDFYLDDVSVIACAQEITPTPTTATDTPTPTTTPVASATPTTTATGIPATSTPTATATGVPATLTPTPTATLSVVPDTRTPTATGSVTQTATATATPTGTATVVTRTPTVTPDRRSYRQYLPYVVHLGG